MDWEIGIDIYTLLCIKQITNKDLLYSTGNSTQCLVIIYKGKESEKEYIYVYTYIYVPTYIYIHFLSESLCCTPETYTIL